MQQDDENTVGTRRDCLCRVILRYPGGRGLQLQGDQRSVLESFEPSGRQIFELNLVRRHIDRGDLDRRDSIETEGPQRTSAVTPGLKIAVAVQDEDPQRVDHPSCGLRAGSYVVGQVQPLAALQPVVHPRLNVISSRGDSDRGLISGRHISRDGLQLLQRPVDGVALTRSGYSAQRTQR